MKIVSLDRLNAQLLENVAEDVFDHRIDASTLQPFLDCPRHFMVLAVEDGQVIGMASAVEYFHPDKPPQLWINEVGVTPSRRKRGIGRQLVQACIAFGKKRGCVSAWLGTEQTNLAARRCFGSVPDGATPQEFLLFEWDLSDDGATEKIRESEPPTA